MGNYNTVKGYGLLAVCLGLMFFVGARARLLTADEANSPDARKHVATHIFIGEVTEQYTKVVAAVKPKGRKRNYLFEVRIERVERGNARATDVVYVRAFRRLSGDGSTGARWGHDPIPKVGDRVRVYAVQGPYRSTGQTDRGLSAAYENGFEILKKRVSKKR